MGLNRKVLLLSIALIIIISSLGCGRKATNSATSSGETAKGGSKKLFDLSGINVSDPVSKDGKLFIQRGSEIKAARFNFTITDIIKRNPEVKSDNYYVCGILEVTQRIGPGFVMWDTQDGSQENTPFETYLQVPKAHQTLIFDYTNMSLLNGNYTMINPGKYNIVIPMDKGTDGLEVDLYSTLLKKDKSYFIDDSAVTGTSSKVLVYYYGYDDMGEKQMVVLSREPVDHDRPYDVHFGCSFYKYGDKLLENVQYDVRGGISNYVVAEVEMPDGIIYRLCNHQTAFRFDPNVPPKKITLKDMKTGKEFKVYTDMGKILNAKDNIKWMHTDVGAN